MNGQFEQRLEFDWNEGNLNKNWLKHKVSNKEAEESFRDPLAFLTKDVKHSGSEARYQLLAQSPGGRLLTIYFTLRGNMIRIISARPMNKKEKRQYEKV